MRNVRRGEATGGNGMGDRETGEQVPIGVGEARAVDDFERLLPG